MPEPAVTTAYRSALEVIAAAEPDVANAIVGELESQRPQLKTHRLGKLRVAGGAAGNGELALGQARRGNQEGATALW
jgi:hypothetical protein